MFSARSAHNKKLHCNGMYSFVAEKLPELQGFEDKGVTLSVVLKHVRGSSESGVGLVNHLADDLKRN